MIFEHKIKTDRIFLRPKYWGSRSLRIKAYSNLSIYDEVVGSSQSIPKNIKIDIYCPQVNKKHEKTVVRELKHRANDWLATCYKYRYACTTMTYRAKEMEKNTSQSDMTNRKGFQL